MRHIREVLRQKLLLGRSHREAALSVGISSGAVAGAVGRAKHVGLTWDAIDAMSDTELDERIFGPRGARRTDRPMPDPVALHVELRRVGVTLQLLHLEYLERQPNGYRYSRFCAIYNDWLVRQRPSMRQLHEAGAKLFVDYSGKRPQIVEPATGQVIDVELFVAVLGASNLTYVEATRTQRGEDWIASHVRALEFFGGVSRAIVPDQLKSGVTRACLYEPEVQRTYEEFARHYGTTVLPARPKHPRDKAKVEVAVLLAQRWILARLRHETFFALPALNARIAELLIELNDRPMRGYAASRRALFESIERATLRPLPVDRFEFAHWKIATVHIDYHFEISGHYYSVHHSLIRERVDVRFTDRIVEVFIRGDRHTSHVRSFARGRHTTKPEHMPKAHQKHSDWSPARMRAWAATIGQSTAALVAAILEERTHPEQGYRSCLGIIRLGKRYGLDRLEAACARAICAQARSYRHVESILKHGLDRVPPAQEKTDGTPVVHENIRGRTYYH